MATVGDLAQFLLKREPQRVPARLALYHFIKNFFDLERPLQKSMILSFFDQCLHFHYWQNHRQDLGDIVSADLTEFLQTVDGKKPFELSDFWLPSDQQVVNIESDRLFDICLEKHLTKNGQSSDQRRVILRPNKQRMILQLATDGRLRVQIYDQIATLIDGEIRPLSPRISLEYNSHMDLSSQSDQLITLNPLEMVRFRADGGWVQGVVVAGHTFNKVKILDGRLEQYLELFYGLKSLERHYIRAQSDPYYHETIALLEKAVRLSQTGHPEADAMARKAVKQGRMAVKNLYPEDQLLNVLCTRLETYLLKPPTLRPEM